MIIANFKSVLTEKINKNKLLDYSHLGIKNGYYENILLEQLFLLCENNDKKIEFIKNLYNNKNLHDPEHDNINVSATDNEGVIRHIADKADPTPKKEYTQWLTKQYHNKQFYQHDLNEEDNKVKTAISVFHKNKAQLPVDKKDINRFKSLGDLYEVTDNLDPEAKSKNQQKRELKNSIMEEGADLLYHNPETGARIWHIKTPEASMEVGKGTKWCTASNNVETSTRMFNRYNNDGNIYAAISSEGNKFQIHNASKQYMDDKDINIGFKGVLSHVPEFMHIKDHMFNDARIQDYDIPHSVSNYLKTPEEHENNPITSKLFDIHSKHDMGNRSYEKSIGNTFENENMDDELHEHLEYVSSHKLLDKFFSNGSLTKLNPNEVGDGYYRRSENIHYYPSVSENPFLGQHHIDKIVDNIKDFQNSPESKVGAEDGGVSSHVVKTLINISSKTNNPEHIKYASDVFSEKKETQGLRDLARRTKSPEALDYIIDNHLEKHDLIDNVLDNSNFGDKQARKIINLEPDDIITHGKIMDAVSNTRNVKEFQTWALSHPHPYVRQAAIEVEKDIPTLKNQLQAEIHPNIKEQINSRISHLIRKSRTDNDE